MFTLFWHLHYKVRILIIFVRINANVKIMQNKIAKMSGKNRGGSWEGNIG